MTAVFDVVEHIVSASHIREFPRATAVSQDDELRLHVKQYLPRDGSSPRRGDLTVIAAHANGFPKELYEPLWDDFYHEARRHGVRIRAVWIADAAWQGCSGLLNQGKLGNDPCWNDYARDIAHLINTFRMPRPLFAIGHSFGANALVNTALLHPRFFIGLVLLDPVIHRFDSSPLALLRGPAALSMYRRQVWPSRVAAAESFRKNKFYQAWDPRVLEKWIEHGIRTVDAAKPDGEVTLMTSRDQETFTYMRPSWPAYDADGEKLIYPDLAPDLDPSLDDSCTYPFYRAEGIDTLERLPAVRPGVLYVLGGKSFTMSQRSVCADLTRTGTGSGGSGGASAGRVRQHANPDYGHLIPMEAPLFCAREAAVWARMEMDRWWADERAFYHWAAQPLSTKTSVSDEFKKRTGVREPKRPAPPLASL